jgi:DNA-binding NarL/FixJ family response regulator
MSARETNDRRARILLVDDHPIVRRGLEQLIDQEPDLVVAAEASTAEEAMSALERGDIDLAVIDVSLQGVSGIELVKQLRGIYPNLMVLMLSMYDEMFYAERALRAGAQGYIMKQRATSDIVGAIRTVLEGDLYVSRELSEMLLRRMVAKPKEPDMLATKQLSDREIEVLQLIGNGVPTREIATRLNLSIKTIESYRANIKRKLQLQNASELSHYAFEWVRTLEDQGV